MLAPLYSTVPIDQSPKLGRCLSLSLKLERCSASPRVCLTRSVGVEDLSAIPFERKIEHWIKRVH